MTFDLRTWALHDAVFQLARESGLDSFRVECKQGPEGETVIALVLRDRTQRLGPAGSRIGRPTSLGREGDGRIGSKKGA
jgi:hypothetical protein